MKEGWTYKKLGEVAEIEYGTRVVQKRDGGSIYPVYGGGGATFLMDTYNREDRLVVARFAMSKTCTRFVEGKFFLNDSGLTLRAKEGIITNYLNWHVIALNDKIYSISKGAAQKNLDMKAFVQLSIHYPISLPIQQQIVNELDTIHSILDKKNEQLKELDKLAQAIFYDMFGDPVTNEKGWSSQSLSSVAPTSKYTGIVERKEGKIWLLNLDMVEQQTGAIIEKVWEEESNVGNSTTTFNNEYVLYSKLRPYLNKVVLPSTSGYCTTELVPLRPKKDILNRVFLASLLRSKSFVEYINIKVAGAKMPRVSMDVFRAFQLILPPLSLQQSFAAKVEAIEAQKELIRQSIREVETLLAQTMDKYFG